jgi:hypothetical protein
MRGADLFEIQRPSSNFLRSAPEIVCLQYGPLRQHSYKRAGWPIAEDFADRRREEALKRNVDESVHMGETTSKAKTGGAELRRSRPTPLRLREENWPDIQAQAG